MTAELTDGRYEVTCPHCSRPFSAPLLDGGARQQGFKCPHCRLFVPLSRVEAQRRGPAAPAS